MLAASLALGLSLAGCAAPYQAPYPLTDHAHLVVTDERPEAQDMLAAPGWAMLDLIPLVPYASLEEQRFLDRSFADELAAHMVGTGAFRDVRGPNDPYALRLESDLELELVVERLSDRRTSTAWGLGLAGAALWFVGIPQELTTTEAKVRLEWRPRPPKQGEVGLPQQRFETRGEASVSHAYLVYQNVHGQARERAREALERAVEQALRRGFAELKLR